MYPMRLNLRSCVPRIWDVSDYEFLPRKRDMLRPWDHPYRRDKGHVSRAKKQKGKPKGMWIRHLNIDDFRPEDIEVKVKDRTVTVSAKTQQRGDDGCVRYAEMTEKFMLPSGVNEEKIRCFMRENGKLTLKAPVKHTLPLSLEKQNILGQLDIADECIPGGERETCMDVCNQKNETQSENSLKEGDSHLSIEDSVETPVNGVKRKVDDDEETVIIDDSDETIPESNFKINSQENHKDKDQNDAYAQATGKELPNDDQYKKELIVYLDDIPSSEEKVKEILKLMQYIKDTKNGKISFMMTESKQKKD